MRICFIEDTTEFGGGQEWAYDTMLEVLHSDNEINLIVPDKNEVFIKKCSKIGVNIYTYNWEKISVDTTKYSNVWKKALKDSDIALCSVHPPRNSFHCTKFAAQCIKESGSTAILIPKTGTIVPTYTRDFYLPDPNVSTQIITITEFTKKALMENYNIPKHQIKTIYQGTNPTKYTSSTHTKTQAAERYPTKREDTFTLGVVGKLEVRKGHVVLIEAIKQIVDNHNLKVRAYFIGEGPTEKEIRQNIKELGLSDYITIFPFTSESQYFYDAIDALVLPSIYKEGLPNVLLEAMLMEKPCIASNLAGTSEIVHNDKTGYLVEPGNTNELVDTIVNLANQKQEKLKELGNYGRNYILNNFDRKNQANKYLEFFKTIKKEK